MSAVKEHGRETRPGLSVVIPVFNAAASIADVCAELARVLDGMGRAYEIILVNDGSADSSWPVILDVAARMPAVRGIGLLRNYGQHNALLCGIRAARHDVVVTMDDDLQHPPEEIAALLAELDRGYDVVYGVPDKDKHSVWRWLSSQVTKAALSTVMGARTARSVSAFRAFRTRLRDAFAGEVGPFVSIDVLLTWGASAFSSVRVDHRPRTRGTSNYTFGKLVAHALNMVTGFSTVPLQLASWVGFVLTLFGVGVLVYVLVRYLVQGSVVAGFPFLASIIAVFSGAQLFALGIIGEYLARVHFRSMGKPPYAVGDTTADTGEPRS
jgi:glycosyltransferase involved in cell wall biosynthesis